MAKLRFTDEQWSKLKTLLLDRVDVETAAIILSRQESGDVLVVESINIIPDDGYDYRSIQHITLNPNILLRLTKEAREKRYSIITIHSHPGAKEAIFSEADDLGDQRLMPSFLRQIPEVLHGSIVLAGSGDVCARLFAKTGVIMPLTVQVVGGQIRYLTKVREFENDEREDRQRLALGADGLSKLKACHIGILGAGGIGSQVCQILGHLGVGDITIVDADVVEESNLPRIVGATPFDAVEQTFKVDVAGRYLNSIESGTRVNLIRDMMNRSNAEKFSQCDLIICCVDCHTPRSILNRFSYKYRTPVIDTGVGFRVESAGKIVGDGGRVVVVGPGRPCLACWGHLDSAKIREEGLSKEDREALTEEGYLSGADVHQPAVMPFNAAIAASAAIEVLRLVTGFGGEKPINRLGFNFCNPSVRQTRISDGQHMCTICRGGL